MNTQTFDDIDNAPDETPLVWGDLFAAMEPTPHRWVRTTPGMYWAMLEAVPPQAMGKGGFLVGEADHHNANGEAVYACFTESAGEYFQARYMTQAEFTGWKAIRS